ncbi:C40 family peptidase [Bacillus gobiensis]|uniref:C40 family peptidase n=1 Tax=Bacillus gobiensis TaxID=1441095 RepID=UPI003D254B76
MKQNTTMFVSTSIANVWTNPESPREIDHLVTSNPVNIREWLDMLNYDQRLQLCTKNSLQSQALFGQKVIVTEEREKWSKVVVPAQKSSKNAWGYPGWIPSCQLSNEGEVRSDHTAVISKRTANLYYNPDSIDFEISFLTKLPITKNSREWLHVQTPRGERLIKTEDSAIIDHKEPVSPGSGTDIVKSGEAFLGLPYLWGGMSGFGFDCSGFVYSMCKANGYRLSRDASDQVLDGKEVPLHELLPGDLLFFAYEKGRGRIHHVGIYYGDGKMLHSPKTGRTVEIITLIGTVYEQELCAARRCTYDAEGYDE